MKPRLLVFNVDFEEELATRAPVTRSAVPERLERRLTARFLFRGTARDTLVAPWELPAEFRQRWADLGFQLPAVAPTADGEALPWGATPWVGAKLPLEVVRRVNAKPFAHELARRLGLAPPGWVCATIDEVAGRLRELEGLWVIKRAFGFAGRGHFLGRGRELPPNAEGWLRKAFAQGDPVVVEPWVERERDYSVQLEVSPEGVVVHGVLELITAANGAYVGNRFGALALPERASLIETARAVGTELAREGYTGPAGIDAYVTAGQLRPLVEVNARHTMGRIALAFERLLPEGGVGSWLTVKAPPREGLVTDPWPDEPGESSVVVVARDRDELAARERSVR